MFGKRPLTRAPNRYRKIVPIFIIILIVVMLIKGFIWIEENIRPTFLAIAEARAKIIAFDAINEAINERVAQNIMYEDLVLVDKDSDGQITMAQTNTMEINRVQAETVRRVQNTLRRIEGEKVNIPLGQVLGSQILATYGPSIPVTLVPIGTVHVDVSHSFSEAGINQTRHKIYLEVYADVQVVIPFISTSREVKTAVPVADTLYMGDVPDTVVELPFPIKDNSNIQTRGFQSESSNTNSRTSFDEGNSTFNEPGDSDFGQSNFGNQSIDGGEPSIPYFNK